MSVATSNCSRFTIIAWINDTLLLPLTKIEELGAGNIYCQLLDAAYPERVPLHKVKWDAKLEVDFLHNFKVLVTAFQFLGIEKKIDVNLNVLRFKDYQKRNIKTIYNLFNG